MPHNDMLTLSFQSVFFATCQILLMAGCGCFLTRRKILNNEGLGLLSRLVMNFFLPCLIFARILGDFNFALYQNWWVFPLLSGAVTISGLVVGQIVCSLVKGIVHKKEFVALVGFQNSGFIPLILISSLFSAEQSKILYVYTFLFLIGFDLAVWFVGVWILTQHRLETSEIKKVFPLPVMSIIVSLIFVMLGLQKFIPEVIMNPIKIFGDCTLPLAMIIVGGCLAGFKLSEVNPKEIIFLVLTKLVILPTLALIVVVMWPVDFLIGFLIVLQMAVPSAVSLSVIARHYKTEETFINQGLIFTHLLSVLTIPVFLVSYSTLKGVF